MQDSKKDVTGMSKKVKKIVCVIAIAGMMLSLTACGKDCANGCGKKADPDCMAGMCDSCCDYWMGLNGCYKEH